MTLTGKQKKYIKKNLYKKELDKIASNLDISQDEILIFLKQRWGDKKYNKFIAGQKKSPQSTLSSETVNDRILSFNLKTWFAKNKLIIIFLALLVLIAYANSLGNEFVSDDVYLFIKNKDFGKLKTALSSPPILLRPILFYILKNLFGSAPYIYRLVNIFLHLPPF